MNQQEICEYIKKQYPVRDSKVLDMLDMGYDIVDEQEK